jgi:starvation-inducible outer membrane lipoprotein
MWSHRQFGYDSFSEDIQIWALNNNFEDDPTPYWYPGLMDATLEASGPILYRIAQHHAYQYTVLMELVSEAKKTGFVNAHYLWLKAMSYRAWLLIDHYGRREPVINIFGITTHWLCEKSHRGKLTETHFGSMEDKSSALWALMESFNQ